MGDQTALARPPPRRRAAAPGPPRMTARPGPRRGRALAPAPEATQLLPLSQRPRAERHDAKIPENACCKCRPLEAFSLFDACLLGRLFMMQMGGVDDHRGNGATDA